MKKNNLEYVTKFLAFLFNPIIGLFFCLSKLNHKSTIWYFFGFGLLYGLAFTPNPNFDFDSNYYLKLFETNNINTLKDLNLNSSGRSDFYVEFIILIIRKITNNYHFLFFTFSLIFSFFAVKSLKYLILTPNFNNKSIVCFLLFVFFMISNPIFNINGVRFWTAGWMAIYLVFKIVLEKNKYYIPLLLIVPLLHPTFWLLILIVIVYFLNINTKILIIGYFISLFLSFTILPHYIVMFQDYLPSSLSYLVDNYANEDYVNQLAEIKSQASWFIVPFMFFNKFYIQLLICLLIKEIKKIKQESLLKFIFLFAIFVNICYDIPSLGVRFNNLLIPLVCVVWLYNRTQLKRWNYIIYFIPIVSSLKIFEFLSYSYDILDPYFYVSPTLFFLFHIIYK